VVYPNSDIHILNPSIFARLGRFFASVHGRFKVQAEHVAAVTEGTRFLTEVAQPGQFRLTVTEGTVRLSSQAGGWADVRVRQGERAIVAGAEAPRVEPVSAAELSQVEAERQEMLRNVRRYRVPVVARTETGEVLTENPFLQRDPNPLRPDPKQQPPVFNPDTKPRPGP